MKNFSFLAKYFLKNEPYHSPVFAQNAFGWFLFLSFCLFQPLRLTAQCSLAFTQCPSSISIMDCDHSGDEAIQWPLIIANTSGFCTGYTLTQTLGPTAGALVPLGTYLVGYTAQAQDLFSGATSTATCNFSVSVIADPSPPLFVHCPPNITVNGALVNGVCTGNAFWSNPITSDNCPNQLTTLSSHGCGAPFSGGLTTVTYTSTDASNNTATCSFTVTVLCNSGTKDLGSSKLDIVIQPNPNTGSFTVDLSEPILPDGIFYITDLTGRLIQEQNTEPGRTQQTVRASELPPGLYFLQVVSKGKILATQKFVKQ